MRVIAQGATTFNFNNDRSSDSSLPADAIVPYSLGPLCTARAWKKDMVDSYIEKALLKIVRQLNAYDEASLMSLWETYAEKVRRFEPTKKWEEAAMIFSIIQGMHMKNQLFNYHWAQSRKPGEPRADFDFTGLTVPLPGQEDAALSQADSADQSEVEQGKAKRGKLLEFKPRK
jgi:hypothetical protein